MNIYVSETAKSQVEYNTYVHAYGPPSKWNNNCNYEQDISPQYPGQLNCTTMRNNNYNYDQEIPPQYPGQRNFTTMRTPDWYNDDAREFMGNNIYSTNNDTPERMFHYSRYPVRRNVCEGSETYSRQSTKSKPPASEQRAPIDGGSIRLASSNILFPNAYNVNELERNKENRLPQPVNCTVSDQNSIIVTRAASNIVTEVTHDESDNEIDNEHSEV